MVHTLRFGKSTKVAHGRTRVKIVKYCGVVGGALVALKSYKHNGAPSLSLRLLNIVASEEGRQNPTKDNGASSLSVKINKYCGVGGVWGGGALGRR